MKQHIMMKLNTFIPQMGIFILLLTLYGCTNVPDHIIIAPDITNITANTNHNKQMQLDVIDMRTSTHIVQITSKGEAAILVSAQKRLEQTIKSTLSEHWKKQNLTIHNNAVNKIKISIEKAIISVNQTTLEYDAQTEIILKVVVNNNPQTLTMTFKNRGSSEGPLKADIAVLERNFNERLSKLLQQILTNKKINDFLI
jgi:uncharacterized lipoprotein